MNWRPMSTAPKDGTVVILLNPLNEAIIGRFYARNPNIGWQVRELTDAFHVCAIEDYYLREPRAWTPFPEPPTDEGLEALEVGA